ncbi:hypothetical protein L0F63_000101 [Massospora cicadina]|nr:hypothetical protein L0F63_000101 [Massospora cicadina]
MINVLNVALPGESGKKVKVTMLSEQTSHHPPVSAFWLECKDTGVIARGCDHLSAKFTGTGWFTGSLYLALQDRRWVGKARHAVEGIIFKYTPTYTQGFTTHSDLPPDSLRFSDIPESDVLARISGSYKDVVFITRSGEKKKEILIDMGSLDVIPNTVKPLDQMDELESHRVWKEVTDNIIAKNYAQATKAKLAIEDAQRVRAKSRAERGIDSWQPKYFKVLPKHLEHCPELLDDAHPKY